MYAHTQLDLRLAAQEVLIGKKKKKQEGKLPSNFFVSHLGGDNFKPSVKVQLLREREKKQTEWSQQHQPAGIEVFC